MNIEYVINTEIVIPNVTIKNALIDGVHRLYILIPNDGYVLHDKRNDVDLGNDTTLLRYCVGDTSVGANYDFTTTTVIDGYTAYGVNEFFARPISEVPTNQIYGLKPDTETI